MSEFPSPDVAGIPVGGAQEALNADAIESVLADFRAWLEQAARPPGFPLPGAGELSEKPIDLHTLLGQFTALRHEVNLQTKATRAQQEQNTETLQQFGQALQSLRQAQNAAQQAEQQSQEERLRPLLKTLVDLADVLTLAQREVQRVQEATAPVPEELAALPQPAPPASTDKSLSWWSRWFGSPTPAPSAPETGLQPEDDHAPQVEARRLVEQMQRVLDSVATGYTMSVQRVERALQQHGLEPIPTRGEPFDPELMEVLEVVPDSGYPPGEVIDEVRRGYRWRGRVFRYAQVRVAK